jgi:peptide deformylase
MAVREIVLYTENEAALRKKSEPVTQVNRRIKNLINDLKDTLLAHSEGIGLAAPQINAHWQVIAVRLGGHDGNGKEPGPPLILINPTIAQNGDEQRDFDGCLSFPGLFGETMRPHRLRVTGLNEWGKPFDRVFEGFDAVVVHHEIDHLNGVLFIDRIQNVNDLYRVREDENGKLVRAPVTTVAA